MDAESDVKGSQTRNDAKENFSSFYLTLVGIIQSLALGFLLYEAAGHLGGHRDVTQIIRIVTSFVIILLVWHEYVLWMISFRWVLGIWDSVIPFLLGVIQYGVIENIGDERGCSTWFFWMAGFVVVGIGSYINMFWKARREVRHEKDGRNKRVFRELGTGLYAIFAIAVAALAISLVAGGLPLFAQLSATKLTSAFWATILLLAMFVSLIVLRALQWIRLVRPDEQ